MGWNSTCVLAEDTLGRPSPKAAKRQSPFVSFIGIGEIVPEVLISSSLCFPNASLRVADLHSAKFPITTKSPNTVVGLVVDIGYL